MSHDAVNDPVNDVHDVHDAKSRGGRKPRVPGACSSMRLSIRLTPEERRDLEAVARENHTNLADVLREAVNEYVADYRERPLFSPVPSAKSKG